MQEIQVQSLGRGDPLEKEMATHSTILAWRIILVHMLTSFQILLLLSFFLLFVFEGFSSVQLLSRVRLFATPLIAACQASLSITNSQSPSKAREMQIRTMRWQLHTH